MDIAQNLMNAVAAVKLASSEIQDMFDEFSNYLTAHVTNSGISFKEIDKLAADPETFVVGWVQDAWRQSYIAAEGGRVRRSSRHGELTIVADLGRTGLLAERFGKPYVYVMWAPELDTWVGSIDDPGDLLVDSGPFVPVGEKVLVWVDEGEELEDVAIDFQNDPASRAWFFAVPMMSIDTRKKVQDALVWPVFHFLNGEISELSSDHPADNFELKESVLMLK